MTRVTRYVLAVMMAAHGLIHLIGSVVPWDMGVVEGFPYDTTVLGGSADLGNLGVRLIGIVWLACAVGFVAVGVGIGRRSSWALPLVASLTPLSLTLCLLGLPETAMGILVNAAILGGVAGSARTRATEAEVLR